MLRTFDHKIISNITSKTMPRAALIVATRFEIRDISAILIPTDARASIRSKRVRSVCSRATRKRLLICIYICTCTWIYIFIATSIPHRFYRAHCSRESIHRRIHQRISRRQTLKKYFARTNAYFEAFVPRVFDIFVHVSVKLSAEKSQGLFLSFSFQISFSSRTRLDRMQLG